MSIAIPQARLRCRHGVMITLFAGAGRRLHRKKGFANRAGVEKRLREAVDGISPVILRDRQFAVVAAATSARPSGIVSVIGFST